MASPASVLGQARGFARDFPRDEMPDGFLWDMVDFLPQIGQAKFSGRGGWLWGSDSLGTAPTDDADSGILATFLEGDQLLIATDSGKLMQPPWDYPYDTTAPVNRGATFRSLQNPVQIRNKVVQCSWDGSVVPQIWNPTGAPVPMNAAFKKSKFATVWKSMLVTGGTPGEEHVVRFSVPGADLTTAGAYDDASNYLMSQKITGLAALRTMILVFHPHKVERIRGSKPASSVGADPGDLIRENAFDDAGCQDPKSIAYYNDNVIFADEHGVHITDGSVIKNMVVQGGLQNYWRTLWDQKTSVCGTVFLDYYIVTLRGVAPRPPAVITPGTFLKAGTTVAAGQHAVGEHTDEVVGPSPPPFDVTAPMTLICDLTRRQWFRFTNMSSVTYIASAGGSGMERIWGAPRGYARLSRIGPTFFPGQGSRIDADGKLVLPSLESPWYKLGEEGRKRSRFAYLTYDARTSSHSDVAVSLAYARVPDGVYYATGALPSTSERTRWKLPLGQFSYGLAFQLSLQMESSLFNIHDLAVESQAAERSRV